MSASVAAVCRVAIDRLVAEGYAEVFKGNRGARLVKVVRVFREADEWEEP